MTLVSIVISGIDRLECKKNKIWVKLHLLTEVIQRNNGIQVDSICLKYKEENCMGKITNAV